MIRAAIIGGVWVGLLAAMTPAAHATPAFNEYDGHDGIYNPAATLDPSQVHIIPAGE